MPSNRRSDSQSKSTSPSRSRFRMNSGDWICPDPGCANVNFARRTSCNRCQKDKPLDLNDSKLGSEIGKVAAERSRGLFSAEDWQCSKCGNINWARRQTCNMCNAPKVGDVEERTGYGGGFNERGNVEYIHRDESDGEYDEFGRKKKKYRGHNEDKSHSSRSRDERKDEEKKSDKHDEEPLRDVKDDEEEEEDDDDGEDVSKYDLSGWGDDDEDDNKEADKTAEEKAGQDEEDDSRSRSKEESTNRDRSRSPIDRS